MKKLSEELRKGYFSDMWRKAILAKVEALEAERDRYRAALEQMPCRCDKPCPQCLGPLRQVRNTSRYLNDDQFDSIRAGDWYCESCKGAEASSGFKYFWDQDLDKKPVTPCVRCAALSAGQSEGAE